MKRKRVSRRWPLVVVTLWAVAATLVLGWVGCAQRTQDARLALVETWLREPAVRMPDGHELSRADTLDVLIRDAVQAAAAPEAK